MILTNIIYFFYYIFIKKYNYRMGIGDWGLGIGDWGLGIGPNPQSPIPNPQLYFLIKKINNIS